jgi:hypothetical protein
MLDSRKLKTYLTRKEPKPFLISVDSQYRIFLSLKTRVFPTKWMLLSSAKNRVWARIDVVAFEVESFSIDVKYYAIAFGYRVG